MEITKDTFKTLNSDQKLDYIYEVLSAICIRIEHLENNRVWTRIFSIGFAAVGGAAGYFLMLIRK